MATTSNDLEASNGLLKDLRESYISAACSGRKERPPALEKLDSRVASFICSAPTMLLNLCHVLSDIYHSSAENPSWAPGQGARALSAIQCYIYNVLDYPWKHEFRIIKMYGGFYKGYIERNVQGAETLFDLIGYKYYGGNELRLDNVKKRKIADAAFDIYFGEKWFNYLDEIHRSIKQKGYTAIDVWKAREKYIGLPRQVLSQMEAESGVLSKKSKWSQHRTPDEDEPMDIASAIETSDNTATRNKKQMPSEVSLLKDSEEIPTSLVESFKEECRLEAKVLSPADSGTPDVTPVRSPPSSAEVSAPASPLHRQNVEVSQVVNHVPTPTSPTQLAETISIPESVEHEDVLLCDNVPPAMELLDTIVEETPSPVVVTAKSPTESSDVNGGDMDSLPPPPDSLQLLQDIYKPATRDEHLEMSARSIIKPDGTLDLAQHQQDIAQMQGSADSWMYVKDYYSEPASPPPPPPPLVENNQVIDRQQNGAQLMCRDFSPVSSHVPIITQQPGWQRCAQPVISQDVHRHAVVADGTDDTHDDLQPIQPASKLTFSTFGKDSFEEAPSPVRSHQEAPTAQQRMAQYANRDSFYDNVDDLSPENPEADDSVSRLLKDTRKQIDSTLNTPITPGSITQDFLSLSFQKTEHTPASYQSLPTTGDFPAAKVAGRPPPADFVRDGKLHTKAKSLSSPRLDAWQCKTCTLANNTEFKACQACGAARSPQESDLQCSLCTLINKPGAVLCDACGTQIKPRTPSI